MKNVVYVALALTVLYTSCKKKEDPTLVDPNPVVLSFTQTPSGATTSYSYDGEGRVVQIDQSSGAKTTITYSGDTVTEMSYNDTGLLNYTKVIFLNTKGLASSSYITDTLGSIVSYTNYQYDSSDFRIAERTYDISNNLIGEKDWSVIEEDIYYHEIKDIREPVNNVQFSYTFSYEKETTVGSYNTGRKYYGKSSKHLIITQTKRSYDTGNAYYTYRYTFDSYGRIATQGTYNHEGKSLYTNTYSYR